MGGDGFVEVPSSSLHVWGVWGGGGQPGEPSNPVTNQVSILTTYQHTNHTNAQQERGGGLLDVLKKEVCNLLEPTCSGGSSNNWLERHRNIAGTTY